MKTNPDNTNTPSPGDFGGLSDLSWVTLDARHQSLYAVGEKTCRGGPVWRQRKLAELREYLALAQVSGRIETMMVDLSSALRLFFRMRVTVPTLPDPTGDLVVGEEVNLGLMYRERAIQTPQPGYSFVEILSPNHVWLANVSPSDPKFSGMIGPGQALCLGARLDAGIPVKELVLMSFGALTLQSVQLDATDSAGVMNFEAAKWWLQNRKRIPLTRENFITTETEQETGT